MAGGTTDGSRWRAYTERLAQLEGVSLAVGIQGTPETTEGGTQLGSGRPPAEPAELVQIALANEFGEGVPERPWLRTTFADHQRSWVKGMKEAVPKVDSPDGHELATWRLVAQVMRGDAQASIRDGGWEPNAEATVAAKGSDQPLIDTGQMLQSVRAALAGYGPGLKVLA